VPGHGHRRTVYLAEQQHSVRIHANLIGNRLPFTTIVTKLEARVGKEVVRDGQQWTATKHGSPGRLRPLKSIGRLG
jgi:hypothetical protein